MLNIHTFLSYRTYLKRIIHSIFYNYNYIKKSKSAKIISIQVTTNARFARGTHLCNMLSNRKVAYNIRIPQACKAAAMHVYQEKDVSTCWL